MSEFPDSTFGGRRLGDIEATVERLGISIDHNSQEYMRMAADALPDLIRGHNQLVEQLGWFMDNSKRVSEECAVLRNRLSAAGKLAEAGKEILAAEEFGFPRINEDTSIIENMDEVLQAPKRRGEARQRLRAALADWEGK